MVWISKSISKGDN